MRRAIAITLAGALALLLAGNGLVMLLAGRWWYGAVPGVIETGPFNPHFVKDIGAAYVVSGAGFAAFAWRPAGMWPALAASTAFLTLHACVHLADAATSATGGQDLVRDFGGVFAPALIGIALSVTSIRPQELAHA